MVFLEVLKLARLQERNRFFDGVWQVYASLLFQVPDSLSVDRLLEP